MLQKVDKTMTRVKKENADDGDEKRKSVFNGKGVL